MLGSAHRQVRITRAIISVIALVFAVGWLGGCDLDRDEGILMAAGSYGDLAVVVSDDSLMPGVGRFLSQLNAPLFFVIQEEEPYNVDIYGPRKWKLCKHYKNILLAVVWNDGGAPVREAEKILTAEALARLREGAGGIEKVTDPYARYQFALVAAAPDRNTLASLLQRNVEVIRDLLEKESTERILRRFRKEGIHTELDASYRRQLGFGVEIPTAYKENQVKLDGTPPGIEWMRTGPSRGLTLTWSAVEDPVRLLTERSQLLDIRRRMGEDFHSEEVVDIGLRWSEERLGELDCLKLEGSWASTDFDGGGPFWCYFIPDPDRGRLYCLDLLVYAPGRDKMPYFREMRAIVTTFRPDL